MLPWRGDVRLAAITYEDVQTWVSGLSVDGGGVRFERGLSASRVVQTYQVLNMVLKYTIRAKRLTGTRSLMSSCRPLVSPRSSISRINRCKNLRSRRAGSAPSCWCCPIAVCGSVTASRRKHVEFAAARMWVRASATHVARQGIVERDNKTHEDRKVPIPASVVDLLRTGLPTESEALVFPGRKGGYLPLGEFRWTFDQAVTALQSAAAARRQEEIEETGEAATPEFPTITPHELRHTCVICTGKGRVSYVSSAA